MCVRVRGWCVYVCVCVCRGGGVVCVCEGGCVLVVGGWLMCCCNLSGH